MDEHQTGENKKYCAVLAIGVGVLVTAGAITRFGIAQREHQMFRVYLCTAAGLLLAYLCYALLAKLTASKPLFGPETLGDGQERSEWLYKLITILCCVITFGLVNKFFSLRTADTSLGGFIAGYFSSAIIACVVLSAMRDSKTYAGKLALIISILFAFVLVFYYSFIPNLYDHSTYEIHHYNAVVQQIYNVAFNEPYTWESSGIYGHYAIFLWPFLKIFGHGPVTINLLIVAGALISEAAFAAVVCKVTKNNILRAAAVLAGCTLFLGRFYGAFIPTRLLWPMVILAYILYVDGGAGARKRPYLFWGLGYILCGIGITWNTDSGIVATAAYSISIWLRVWRDELPFSKRALKTYGLTLLGCAGAILLMIAIINIYNLLCGGPLVLEECFFPMLGGEGYVSGLQFQADQFENGSLPTIVFVVSIITGMLSLRFIGACKTDRLSLAFCSLMGLGQSYYYFNRAVAGWGCVRPYLILCAAFIAEFAWEKGKSTNNLYAAAKKASGISCVIILSAMIFTLCYYSLSFLSGKAEYLGVMDSFNELCEAVEREVPEDTFAFGYLTQDVYAALGWDPGYHYRDSSDMFGEGIENVFEEISSHDMILVGRSNYSTIAQNCPEFVIVKEIMIGPDSEDGTETKPGFYLMEKTDGAAA